MNQSVTFASILFPFQSDVSAAISLFPTDSLLQPNPAQVVAIESAAEKCLRKAGPTDVVKAQDLQNPDASPEPAVESVLHSMLSLLDPHLCTIRLCT